jgi:hypothetical protein
MHFTNDIKKSSPKTNFAQGNLATQDLSLDLLGFLARGSCALGLESSKTTYNVGGGA